MRSQEFPFITSLVRNINTRKATIAVGEREELLHGQRYIEELLDGLRFRISANSFFQTNPRQAENLFRLAIEAAKAGADGLRLNPGNIGGEKKVKAVVDCAKELFGLEVDRSACSP